MDNVQGEDAAGSIFRYSKKKRTQSGSSMELDKLFHSDQEVLDIKVENNHVEGKMTPLKSEPLDMLYQKVEKLNDLFLEQNKLLAAIKRDIVDTNNATQSSCATFGIANMLAERFDRCSSDQSSECSSAEDRAQPGRRLLDAIECNQLNLFDSEINNALIEMLNSEDLKERVVSATMMTVKPVVQNCVHHVVTSMHREMLQHEQEHLIEHVTVAIDRAFAELEDKATALARSVSRSVQSLRRQMERQQTQTDASKNFINSLRDLVEHILEEELRQKRGEAFSELLQSGRLPQPVGQFKQMEQLASAGMEFLPPPASPPQPPHSTLPPMAQLLYAAQISKYMDDGDVSSAFNAALCCGELALVVAACHAAPARAAAYLPQHVLLSLVQQLATDLVHDTQLKCRYIEDAILNLDPSDPTTRIFLPKVIGDVLSNLSRFVNCYPNHVASRRIKIIILACSKLL